MGKKIMGLFALIKLNRQRPAYVLLTSLLVLMCICLTLVFQYHYYANQWQIQRNLTASLVKKTQDNLRAEKVE